jgi:MarR family transcriptional regulator, organic hydroperoxide resistance regulator
MNVSILIRYQLADMDSGKHPSKKPSIRKAAEATRSVSLMRRVLLGFKAKLDEELREKNATTAQMRFLREVKERPGSSGAQMARACYVTPQSAQAMMARAVQHGWLERGKSAENDRVVTARLTPEGERLLAYFDGVMERLEAEVWAGVSVAELRAMNELLERSLTRLDV